MRALIDTSLNIDNTSWHEVRNMEKKLGYMLPAILDRTTDPLLVNDDYELVDKYLQDAGIELDTVSVRLTDPVTDNYMREMQNAPFVF